MSSTDDTLNAQFTLKNQGDNSKRKINIITKELNELENIDIVNQIDMSKWIESINERCWKRLDNFEYRFEQWKNRLNLVINFINHSHYLF